jgi:AmiR/NasT family two-component response regulator
MAANPVLRTLTERRRAAHEQAQQARQLAIQARARVLDTIQLLTDGRDRRSVLDHSAYARLAARLETMPVVEQAKGILIAQTGCTPDDAFEILRTASQRQNVKLREIAQKMVEGAVREGRDGSHRLPRAG